MSHCYTPVVQAAYRMKRLLVASLVFCTYINADPSPGTYVKEATSCFNTRIAGPDGNAFLFSNYSSAYTACEARDDCLGVYDHSCIDPNDPSAVCTNWPTPSSCYSMCNQTPPPPSTTSCVFAKPSPGPTTPTPAPPHPKPTPPPTPVGKTSLKLFHWNMH